MFLGNTVRRLNLPIIQVSALKDIGTSLSASSKSLVSHCVGSCTLRAFISCSCTWSIRLRDHHQAGIKGQHLSNCSDLCSRQYCRGTCLSFSSLLSTCRSLQNLCVGIANLTGDLMWCQETFLKALCPVFSPKSRVKLLSIAFFRPRSSSTSHHAQVQK